MADDTAAEATLLGLPSGKAALGMWGVRLLGVAGVLVVAAALLSFGGTKAGLECGPHPTGGQIVEVELAGSNERALDALLPCSASQLQDALTWDYVFIAGYVALLGSTAWFFGQRGFRTKSFRLRSTQMAWVALAAGLLDVGENVSLWRGLEADGGPFTGGPVAGGMDWAAIATAFSWAKWLLVVLVVAYVTVAFLGWVVTPGWVTRARALTREQQQQAEHDARPAPAGADPAVADDLRASARNAPDEAGSRWRRGLAFSGGGVRSATFGLGGAQGLDAAAESQVPRWTSSARVTAISGGAYIAGGQAIARSSLRREEAGAPPPPPDAWARGGVEEKHLRANLRYLLAGPDGVPGALATLLLGIVVNAFVLLLLLFVVATPVGWLSGSCLVEPTLQVPYERLADEGETPAQGEVAREVACGSAEVTSRAFTLDRHQYGAPAAWLAIGVAALLLWVLSSRVKTIGIAPVAWVAARLHRNLKPVVFGALGISAALWLLLVLIPWSLTALPDLLQKDTETEAATGDRSWLVQAILVTGLLGSIATVVKTQVVKRAATLGGLLLVALAVLVGGEWAADAAEAGPAAGSTLHWGLDAWSWPLHQGYWSWLLLFVVIYAVANPEWWSMAPFYRGRLRSAFATFRTTDGQGNVAARAYGNDDTKAPGLVEPSLHEFATVGSGGLAGGQTASPLVVCAAATVSDKTSATHYRIPAFSVTFTPDHMAVHRPVFGKPFARRVACDTQTVERLTHRWDSPRLTTMAAVGMSGAAFSPAMGRQRKGSTGALLAFANLRLGVWVPNPEHARWLQEAADHHHRSKPDRWLAYPRIRIGYLLKELFGLHDPDELYLYVTDGGHWENTGLVEMVRTGEVDEIVAFDASGVSIDSVAALAEAIDLAPLECDVNIAIRFDALRAPPDGTRGGGRAERAVTLGLVRYPKTEAGTEARTGLLWYGKPVLTDDAPARLHAYRERDPSFPAHGTLDQFFDDTQFVAYAELGRTCAGEIVRARRHLVGALRACNTRDELVAYSQTAAEHWALTELVALLNQDGDEYTSLRQRLLAAERVAAAP